MKKTLALISVVFVVLSLSSCYQDKYYNSLEEYTSKMNNQGIGYSNTEIDVADHFLPSQTFISDFEYINGGYHYYEENIFKDNGNPDTSILYLQYEPTVYSEAKDFTLENIPAYGEEVYTYNDYVFYQNENFVSLKGESYFPRWFTMVCYNDTNNTLIFLGFYKSTSDIKDISNWQEFIDTYYGEYYDFNA